MYCGHYWYTMYVLWTLLVYNVCTVDITGIQCMYCGHYWYTMYVLWTLPVYNVCTIRSNLIFDRCIRVVDTNVKQSSHSRGRRGRDPMVVGFTATCAISVYHH